MDDRDPVNAQSATLTLEAIVTVAGAITNRALVVAQDQPDPVASNNSAAAVVNGAANADVGVTTAVDRPAPSVGENVTFTVTVVNSRSESRDRDGRHRCAARGSHPRVGHTVAGHLRGAHLDHRHARARRGPQPRPR